MKKTSASSHVCNVYSGGLAPPPPPHLSSSYALRLCFQNLLIIYLCHLLLLKNVTEKNVTSYKKSLTMVRHTHNKSTATKCNQLHYHVARLRHRLRNVSESVAATIRHKLQNVNPRIGWPRKWVSTISRNTKFREIKY